MKRFARRQDSALERKDSTSNTLASVGLEQNGLEYDLKVKDLMASLS